MQSSIDDERDREEERECRGAGDDDDLRREPCFPRARARLWGTERGTEAGTTLGGTSSILEPSERVDDTPVEVRAPERGEGDREIDHRSGRFCGSFSRHLEHDRLESAGHVGAAPPERRRRLGGG